MRESGLEAITLLSYHNLGAEKLEWLREPAGFRDAMLPRERLEWAGAIVEEEGLRWFEPGAENTAGQPGARPNSTAAGSGAGYPTEAR